MGGRSLVPRVNLAWQQPAKEIRGLAPLVRTSSAMANQKLLLPLSLSHVGTRPSTGGKTASSGSSLVIDTTTSFAVRDSGGLGAASRQLLAVREAFSGDNVVQDFEREKAELEEQQTEKDAPTALPGMLLLLLFVCLFVVVVIVVCLLGWGSWGGEGVRPPKRARQNKPRPPPRNQRKDADLKNVIIFEENKNRKIEQHLVRTENLQIGDTLRLPLMVEL